MRIFLAGASGAIGRRLVPLLRAAGHDVIGTTRSADKAAALARARRRRRWWSMCSMPRRWRARCRRPRRRSSSTSSPICRARRARRGYDAGLERNARLRIEGTRNLVAAAKAAGVRG